MLSWSFHHYMYPYHITSHLSKPLNPDFFYGKDSNFSVVLLSSWIQLRFYRISFGPVLTLACLEITELRFAFCHQMLASYNSFFMVTCNVIFITSVNKYIGMLSPKLLSRTNNIRTFQLFALVSIFCRLTSTYHSYSSCPLYPVTHLNYIF